MAAEDESITIAVLAEDAAERTRRLILILHRYRDAVADGARRGVRRNAGALSGLLPMSRADADFYAAVAASGSVKGTVEYLIGADASLNTPRVKEDEVTMLPAPTSPGGNYTLLRKFILAFSVAMAMIAVFGVLVFFVL